MHLELAVHRRLLVQSRLGVFQQLPIEDVIEAVVLRFALMQSAAGDVGSGVQHAAQVEVAGFPVGDAFAHFQEFGPAYHLIYRPEAQLGHDFAQLLG